MQKLDEMVIFARVVEEKSFSAAAEALGVSKGTASKAVQRLESRLGVRLLNRTTRRFSVTDLGASFYASCARIVKEAEAAEEMVATLTAVPRGRLRVTVSMSFGVDHVAPALPAFLARYPALMVDLDMNDAFVDIVEEGYDLAIRIGRLPDSSLVARKLAPCRQVVCGSPDYVARNGAPRRPADLVHHTCLLYAHAATADAWQLNGPDGLEETRVSGPLRANNGEALRQAALAGVGLTLVPVFFIAEQLRNGSLAVVMPDYGWETTIYAVYPSARHPSTKVQVFLDFFANRFGPTPYWEENLPI